MIPAKIQMVEEIPLLVSGKTDEKKLFALVGKKEESDDDSEDPLENELLNTIRTVFERQDIDLSDNLIEQGNRESTPFEA